jgi:hypothetical protein
MNVAHWPRLAEIAHGLLKKAASVALSDRLGGLANRLNISWKSA